MSLKMDNEKENTFKKRINIINSRRRDCTVIEEIQCSNK